jgi:nitroreductase
MTNQTLSVIKTRRSCRAFKPDSIPRETLEAIIDAGIWAPTGMNSQDVHVTVLQDPQWIKRINDGIRPALPDAVLERMTARNGGDPDFCLFYFAPAVAVLSGGDTSCAIAAENICLAAESLGVGSCMIGLFNFINQAPEGAALLGELRLPEGAKTGLAIALGYAAKAMPVPERKPGRITWL